MKPPLLKEDMLFGKIALRKGIITQQQLDECLKEQDTTEGPRLIGMVLLAKGFITKDQLREILEFQKENAQKPALGADEQKSDIAFGFLAVKRGYTTLNRVYECVREQARTAKLGLFFRLGEIFVNKGYLTVEQVQEILRDQKKTILECEGCGSRFNVIGYEEGKEAKCTKCNRRLVAPRTLETPAVDDSIELL
ncbi:MAG: hypothetical protein MUC63_00550 [Planctomycetes bacterium]|nr:hypothetical protein [Planctomycetota bacterium]